MKLVLKMNYNLIISKNAYKDINKLSKENQIIILKKIYQLKENPNLGKPLLNILKKYKRLRVNKYRVLYFIKENDIVIVRIGHRKNIYDIKKKNSLREAQADNINEKIIIVNKLDEVIRVKERYLISKKDIYRVSVLIVKNSKNEILLAKRSLNKKKDPGLWGPSVAGTNALEEDYVGNILKEAEEEIGLLVADFELQLIEKVFIKSKNAQFFASIFLVTIDDYNSKHLKIDKIEVDSIQWFSKAKLKKELKENSKYYFPIVNSFLKYYNL